MRRASKLIIRICIILLLVGTALWQRQVGAQASEPPWAAEAFKSEWQRTDARVARGRSDYSWYWGPQPRSAPLLERYDEVTGGKQLVIYYDKGRMELPLAGASGKSAAQLTFGRLVYEMVSGNLQLGDQRFDSGAPAGIPIAGDTDDPTAPTYASFSKLASSTGASAAAPAQGQRPNQQIDRAGKLTTRDDLARAYPATTYSAYDTGLGHNIPRAFDSFMRRRGLIETPSGTRNDQLIDSLAVVGRPLTEAYWVEVELNDVVQPILVQLFERRVLTYNPTNPPAFQVEMGNVGLHYYKWRYGGSSSRSARREELLSHFENGDQSLDGNYWFSFDDRNDGGSSQASNALIEPGYGGSVRAMRFEYNVTTKIEFGFAALAVNLGYGGNPVDLRRSSAIGFWARGDNNRYSLQLSSALADAPFAATFVAPAEWTWIEIPLSALQQPSDKRSIDQGQGLATATRIAFRPAFSPSSGFLDIDNLTLISGMTVPTETIGLPLLDDFEDGNLTSALNTDWFTYDDRTDSGASTVELNVISPGGDGSQRALRARGKLDNQYGPPYAGFGMPLAPDNHTIDLRDYNAIAISVRTDDQHYRLQLSSALITDGNQYGLTIAAPTEWTPLYIPIKLLAPNDSSSHQPISMELALSQITNLIITPLDQPKAFEIQIDSVRLIK